MKNLILLTVVLFAQLTIFAQVDTKKPTKLNLQYVARINAGYLGGSEFSRNFHVYNGVSFYNHFFASIGVGSENYYSNPYLPITFDFRYILLKRKTSPFISVSSGYLQPLVSRDNNTLKGGYTAGAKIGISHFFSNHVGFETSLGYRFSKVERIENMYYPWEDFIYNPTTIEYNMNRFELSVGLIFK